MILDILGSLTILGYITIALAILCLATLVYFTLPVDVTKEEVINALNNEWTCFADLRESIQENKGNRWIKIEDLKNILKSLEKEGIAIVRLGGFNRLHKSKHKRHWIVEYKLAKQLHE